MRNTKLTNTFKKIERFYYQHKRMPSYSEMLGLAGVRSKNAIFKMVERLSTLGVLSKDETGRIIPGENFGGVKVLGTVEAGFPSPAEEELSDTMSLDQYLIKNREATFILKVKGDSMIEAGIIPGDMVLVERGAQAKDGDIVIAEVDKQWTMKYLKKKGNRYTLLAANRKYGPIVPKQELNIAAIVRAVIRKY